MVRKASGTASWHLAPPAQEVTHAIIDVIVDGPIGHQPRAVAEVVRPAAQQTVQPVAYIRPRFLVAGDQQLIDLAFEPLDALPGGARAGIGALPCGGTQAQTYSQGSRSFPSGHPSTWSSPR